MNSVVLLRAHVDSASSRRLLAALRSSVFARDVVVVAYCKDMPARQGILSDARIYTERDLRELPYDFRMSRFNADCSNGYNDLPVMKFFLEAPRYDFYWIIEYDVRYSGDWDDLFETLSLSRADLLGTTVQAFGDNPDWVHWSGLSINREPVPLLHRVKSFTPFIRLSHAALAAIHELYKKGLDGHFEATWGSSCSMADLSIEDLGGDGAYTPEKWRGRHYSNAPLSPSLSPGTFACLPVLRDADLLVSDATLGPTLWHPVKS